MSDEEVRAAVVHAIEFLDDLEASDNECVQPESWQASHFFMVRADLERAAEYLKVS